MAQERELSERVVSQNSKESHFTEGEQRATQSLKSRKSACLQVSWTRAP